MYWSSQKHLANIFSEGELDEQSTISNLEIVQAERKHSVNVLRKFQAIQDASFKNDFEQGLDEGGFK